MAFTGGGFGLCGGHCISRVCYFKSYRGCIKLCQVSKLRYMYLVQRLLKETLIFLNCSSCERSPVGIENVHIVRLQPISNPPVS
mgnify:CR=1 FL=1